MERQLWPASSSRGPWHAGLGRGWRTARSTKANPPSPRPAPARRPSPRDRGAEPEGTGGVGPPHAQPVPRSCAISANGPRPASPGVPRLWRLPRRTARGPGRRPRSLAAGRARRPGLMPLDQAGIDRTTGLDVHQDSAVAAALAGGVLIDAYHPRHRHLRLGQRLDRAQDRAPTDGHAEHGSQAGRRPGQRGRGRLRSGWNAVVRCTGRACG